MADILIIDDDLASCRTLEVHFKRFGHTVAHAYTFESGFAATEHHTPDLVVLDIRMPGCSGLDGLPRLKQALPNLPVIMITAFHDTDTTIEAMKRGADDYIDKPIDLNELDAAVSKALERKHHSGNAGLMVGDEIAATGSKAMVGRSAVMKKVFKTIGMIATSPATVLITGESGTGKEMVARALHSSGSNSAGPFIAVNCATLVETLLESDLFGHEKGAFTGALTRMPGKFAQARDGTIFLDEIAEISLAIQAKLLRVLQEKEFVPVGGTTIAHSNARVVAATNANLAQLVEAGRFREDLYYRLHVMSIQMPALRERKSDLVALIPILLSRINRELHRNVAHLADDVVKRFHEYDWPGNVRELENVLMEAVAMCPGELLTSDLLPPSLRDIPIAVQGDGESPGSLMGHSLTSMSLEEIQRAHLSRVLAATQWHRGRASEILQISRPRLRRLIQLYGLSPDRKGR